MVTSLNTLEIDAHDFLISAVQCVHYGYEEMTCEYPQSSSNKLAIYLGSTTLLVPF